MQIGKKIIRLESVDSTNNYIANLLKERKLEEGTVILADEQFAGRGQRDAQWVVNPGENLTFSFYLGNVNLSVQCQFYLTCIVSLSLVRLLEKYELNPKIKWPNDIYIGQQKIAGVLIENQLSSSVINSSIIGIGLNVNQLKFEGLNATSLLLETQQLKPPMEVLFTFIEIFNASWTNFSERMFHDIKLDYITHLFQFNEFKSYHDENGDFEGKITDVADSGHLVIERNGELKQYDLKEITFKL